MSSRQPLWKTGAALLAVFLMTACAPIAARQSGTGTKESQAQSAAAGGRTVIVDQAGPAPIILKDTSPGHLALSLYVDMGGYVGADRDITEMAISFSSNGHLVQFVADERMACNGVSLPRGGGTFDTKLPTPTLAGKPVTCTYTSGQSSATLTFTAPPALAILSPEEQATLSRSAKTLVRFRVGGQSTMFYVIALGPNKKAWSYPVGNAPTEVVLDTSAFSPGPGFIALSQSFTLRDLHGTGFESLEGRGDAVQQIAVTWD